MGMNAKVILYATFLIIMSLAANTQERAYHHPLTFAMCGKLPMSADGIIRLSKVEVYPAYLGEYIKFATEVGEISLRTEPGVLTMYALQEKDNPCIITILETYVSQEAYRKHIASAHFRKYKQETLHMVKDLRILDQTELNISNKIVNYIRQNDAKDYSD